MTAAVLAPLNRENVPRHCRFYSAVNVVLREDGRNRDAVDSSYGETAFGGRSVPRCPIGMSTTDESRGNICKTFLTLSKPQKRPCISALPKTRS
jgi:hypothetical protein